MRKALLFLSFLCLLVTTADAQTPGVLWQKKMLPYNHETGGQIIYDIQKIGSGGFVLVGSDTGWTFNKNELLDRESGAANMIIRSDTAGNKIWGRRYHDSHANAAYTSVAVTDAGDFVAIGFKHEYNYSTGLYDNGVVATKFLSNGMAKWDKMFGGSNVNKGQSIAKTNDKGFVIAGYTNSLDTVVTDNHAANTFDFWVIKIDSSGNLQWKKCYGGTGDERAYSVKATLDGGYIVAGKANSTDGDITSPRGLHDGWIVKLDGNGNIMWQKSFGGSNADAFKSIVQTADGGYLAVGNTMSNDQDAIGNHGDWDIFAVRIDANGNLIWRKTIGGTNWETGANVVTTEDNAYLITGHTESNNGDVTGINGGADVWLIKIDDAGSILWNKAIGSTGDEYGFASASSSEHEYYTTGTKIITPTQWDRTDAFLLKLGNTSTIKGTVFLDNNRNGIKDANERFFSDVLVRSTRTAYERSAVPRNGVFNIEVDTGTYQTSVVFNNPYYTVVPASRTTTFASYFLTDSISFALQPMQGKRDLAVHLIALTPARPGFAAQYKIVYANRGTDTVPSGQVQLVKSNKLNFVSALPAQTSINGDTLRWNYTNLKPQDTASIVINFTVAAPPTANNGDILELMATISPVAADLTPADDTSRLRQPLVGSYDPNDKREAHGGTITQQQVLERDWLNYTIRFQNTGSDTAFTVIVRDTLSAKVDWNSLQMISASHDYQLTIKEGNKLTWTFSNIRLVDSVRNEPASHGHIVFRVKPNDNLAAGDVIENAAGIYFDFNLPVQTNTELTTVESVVLPVKLSTFAASRDGASNLLRWNTQTELNLEKYNVEVSTAGNEFKSVGVVAAKGANEYSFVHTNPAKAVNYYRLKMVDKDGRFEYSPVRKVNNTGSFDVSVYPNPVRKSLSFTINSEKMLNAIVEIIDLNGKVLVSRPIKLAAGTSVSNFDVNFLASGTYVLMVKSADREIMTSRFQKL